MSMGRLVGEAEFQAGGGAAGGPLNAAFDRARGVPDTPDPYSNLSAAITRMAPGADVILIGDTNHNDRTLKKPIADPAVLTAARRAGVTDLYVELASEHQGELDALTSGRIDRDTFIARTVGVATDTYTRNYPEDLEDDFDSAEFEAGMDELRERMGQYADIAAAATRAGLRIHAADPQPIADAMEISHLINAEAYGEALDMLRDRRRMYDPVVAADIEARGGGKALIVYGAGHIEHTAYGALKERMDNIDEALERNGTRTATIMLTSHTPENQRIRDSNRELVQPREYERPGYIYNPVTNEGIAGTPPDATATPGVGAQAPPVFAPPRASNRP